MKKLLTLLTLLCIQKALQAQRQPYVYTIKADSVKITNSCDTAELILENHTQNVPGFLFNKGKGRTEFRRALQKVSDSLYLIGGDTLRLSKLWLQGGNAFGATGILGTIDNNHLDFYTSDTQRVRITNRGNVLIGTTTDNGNKLNVNGNSYFSGNVNIGTATITNTGSLINTNAILFNHFISQYHSYMGNDPFISKLDNILYNYDFRFPTTKDTAADGSVTLDITIPSDELTPGYGGVVYPQGNMYFSFWNDGVPQSVTVQIKNSSGSLAGPYTSNVNLATNGSGFFHVSIPPALNFLTEIKVTITPATAGGRVNLQNMEYVLDAGPQGLANGLPFVGKYGVEHLYNFLYFKFAGSDNVRISPYLPYPSYFLNNLLVGTTTDNGNKLQVAGNTSVSGNLTVSGNTINFSGLSGNNSASRIVAADANGNLFYRDASSLVFNDVLNSDLAVNGTLYAQKMKITQTGAWPDYVFSNKYKLPTLLQVEQYIKQNNHLPDVPSAAEVEKKGIDVADNQAVLLKKIEELTLYVIEQEKKLQKQNEEISALKKQNAALDDLKQQMAELKALINKNADIQSK